MKLKYIVPNLDIEEPLALIGSSNRLLESYYGNLIDSFNTVIRFNRAPTENFENHVGTKTTIYYLNRHVIFNTSFGEDEDSKKNSFWQG